MRRRRKDRTDETRASFNPVSIYPWPRSGRKRFEPHGGKSRRRGSRCAPACSRSVSVRSWGDGATCPGWFCEATDTPFLFLCCHQQRPRLSRRRLPRVLAEALQKAEEFRLAMENALGDAEKGAFRRALVRILKKRTGRRGGAIAPGA